MKAVVNFCRRFPSSNKHRCPDKSVLSLVPVKKSDMLLLCTDQTQLLLSPFLLTRPLWAKRCGAFVNPEQMLLVRTLLSSAEPHLKQQPGKSRSYSGASLAIICCCSGLRAHPCRKPQPSARLNINTLGAPPVSVVRRGSATRKLLALGAHKAIFYSGVRKRAFRKRNSEKKNTSPSVPISKGLLRHRCKYMWFTDQGHKTNRPSTER